MSRMTIKIGQIAELSGPLAFMGLANANIVRLLVDEINAAGGLLGRQLELIVEVGFGRRASGRQAEQTAERSHQVPFAAFHLR